MILKKTIFPNYEYKQLYDNPYIFQFDNFMTDDECRYIINMSKNNMKQSVVSGSKGGILSTARTSTVHWIPNNFNRKIKHINKKICDLLDFPVDHTESLQCIHYEPTQEYQAHYDSYDLDTPIGIRCCRKGGQRLATALIYLSDVDDGGETYFPKLNLRIEPKKGRLILFYNVHLGTNNKHPNSLHAGTPVIRGDKWACNKWFRERKYD